jgi:hypothetical protein
VYIRRDVGHHSRALKRKNGARMIQKTQETLPQTIARVHTAAIKAKGWMVIEKVGGGTYFVSSEEVTCHADSIEFTDDAGSHVVVPYRHITALEVRDRQ